MPLAASVRSSCGSRFPWPASSCWRSSPAVAPGRPARPRTRSRAGRSSPSRRRDPACSRRARRSVGGSISSPRPPQGCIRRAPPTGVEVLGVQQVLAGIDRAAATDGREPLPPEERKARQSDHDRGLRSREPREATRPKQQAEQVAAGSIGRRDRRRHALPGEGSAGADPELVGRPGPNARPRSAPRRRRDGAPAR